MTDHQEATVPAECAPEPTQVGCSPQEAWYMYHALEDFALWPDEAQLNKLVADGEYTSYAEAIEDLYFLMRQRAGEALAGIVRPAKQPLFPDTEEPF
jgi:hypothetical protein